MSDEICVNIVDAGSIPSDVIDELTAEFDNRPEYGLRFAGKEDGTLAAWDEPYSLFICGTEEALENFAKQELRDVEIHNIIVKNIGKKLGKIFKLK